jgi:hypothetical protein
VIIFTDIEAHDQKFRDHCFRTYTMDKIQNPVIPCTIHHHQNPLQLKTCLSFSLDFKHQFFYIETKHIRTFTHLRDAQFNDEIKKRKENSKALITS